MYTALSATRRPTMIWPWKWAAAGPVRLGISAPRDRGGGGRLGLGLVGGGPPHGIGVRGRGDHRRWGGSGGADLGGAA